MTANWSRNTVRWLMLMGVIVAMAPAMLRAQQQAADAPVDPEAVRAAIRKGVEYIYSRQTPEGHWEAAAKKDPSVARHDVRGGQWGGQTALTTYALLAAGESPQDPRIRKAVDWLSKAEIEGIYALGMRAQIWHYLPRTAQVQAAARRDWTLLANALAARKDKGIGTYDYLVTSGGNRVDLSVSQYGVLGAWALTEVGIEVPASYWQVVDRAWRGWQQKQNPGGGWAYNGTPSESHPINLSITTAGIATLFITQDFLYANQGVRCNGNISNPHIDAGFAWMSSNIEHLLKGGKLNPNVYYTLYGVERIGVASGMKYFGSLDWYQVGAKWLLARQNKQSGAWNTSQMSGSGGGFCDNAFALIFLSRGSAPVAFNKLQYNLEERGKKVEGNWNQRPRDIANLVRWMGKQVERDLNWQIVNLSAPATELLDAPILYIAGNQALNLSAEDKAKLREYVYAGGLIVGHADCDDSKFTSSFRRLGQELFGSEFRDLPEDHLIYNIQFPRKQMRQKPRWQGLTNGARELMILITGDPAKHWQVQAYGGNEASYQMMMNLFLYAVDRSGIREKGKMFVVLPDPKATARSTIKVGRGQYKGQWDPEPGGWTRLKAVMLNQNSVGLDVQPVDLTKGQIPTDIKVLHLTGTVPLELDDAARQAIKSYVEGGGTLVIDAAGGSSEFATSAEELLRSLWPDKAQQLVQSLPASHPLYLAGGGALPEVQYRGAARRSLTGDFRQPRLRGLEFDGRLGVIYSREDLSVGLVGMPVEGIIGYEPQTATNLMRCILMYASK